MAIGLKTVQIFTIFLIIVINVSLNKIKKTETRVMDEKLLQGLDFI